MDNIHTDRIRGKTNLHHIVPKYYYLDRHIQIDNSPNNLVNMLYSDHILAHYFLAMCSSTDVGRAKNIISIKFLLGGKSIDEIKIDEIDLDEYQKMYEVGRKYTYVRSHEVSVNKKVSETLIGRPSPNKGNIKMTGRKSKVNPNAKNKILSEIATRRVGDKNPFYGKSHSTETRSKISSANSRAVLMISIDTKEVLNEFNSIKEASDYLISNGLVKSLSASCRISRVCRANDLSLCAYGFNWKFVEKV